MLVLSCIHYEEDFFKVVRVDDRIHFCTEICNEEGGYPFQSMCSIPLEEAEKLINNIESPGYTDYDDPSKTLYVGGTFVLIRDHEEGEVEIGQDGVKELAEYLRSALDGDS